VIKPQASNFHRLKPRKSFRNHRKSREENMLRFALFASLFFAFHWGQSQVAGAIEYNTTGNAFEFYDGSTWVSMDNGDTGTPCSSTGSMNYSYLDSRMEFCDGATWRSMMGEDTLTVCTIEGELSYNITENEFEVCNGSTYWSVKPGPAS
jgi:hypothetical protein